MPPFRQSVAARLPDPGLDRPHPGVRPSRLDRLDPNRHGEVRPPRFSRDVLQRLGDVVEELLGENSLCRLVQVSRRSEIIVDEDSVARVTKRLREDLVIGVRRDLVEVAVTSPERIEETPGLLTLLTGVLSAQGINIVEALSCSTDTIFLLDHDDLNAALSVLSKTLQ